MQELVSMWWLFAITGIIFSVVASVSIKRKKYFEGVAFCFLALLNFTWLIFVVL
jgi:hypothetical protein